MAEMAGIKKDGQAYKVLNVDDSPIIHKLIRRALESEGFVICGSGSNGKEGVELYKQHRPDIVTMDITMPIMDGLEAATEIIKNYPDAKILMLSSMGDDSIIEEARQAGITNFHTKPFKNEEFVQAIVQILNK